MYRVSCLVLLRGLKTLTVNSASVKYQLRSRLTTSLGSNSRHTDTAEYRNQLQIYNRSQSDSLFKSLNTLLAEGCIRSSERLELPLNVRPSIIGSKLILAKGGPDEVSTSLVLWCIEEGGTLTMMCMAGGGERIICRSRIYLVIISVM